MILDSAAIRQRIEVGEIFRKDTCVDESIKEASYALRVASDGLIVGGKRYRPGKEYLKGPIVIDPGAIAILSTIERMNMPSNLAGKLGIRFDYATQGLTGLMGIQVDPYFGQGHDDERLYIRVANLGNDPISIPICSEVFTFELHEVTESSAEPPPKRQSMWHRINDVLADQEEIGWSYVTRVQENVHQIESRLQKDLESARLEIREHLQPVVLFGVFLLAVTILGASLAVLLSLRETPSAQVPDWFTNWAWVLLMLTLGSAAIATAAMGFAIVVASAPTAFSFLKRK